MAGPCVKWSDSCESVPDRFYDVRARAHWAMWRAHRWILAQVGTLCIICHIYCDTESSKMETTVSLLSRIRCFVCPCLSYHVSLAGQCDVTRKTATTLYRTETLDKSLSNWQIAFYHTTVSPIRYGIATLSVYGLIHGMWYIDWCYDSYRPS